MHTITFLQDLAVIMIVAGLVTVLFHRFKQPVVLGYIVAGVIVGPHTPPFPLIHDRETIETLSDLGVILLMFSIGLEFSLRKLRRVGGSAFIAAFLEILVMVWLGYQTGRLFGWSMMDSIFLGAMLSVSSTTIIAKSLAELGKTKEHFAHLIFGILIIEDILAILMLVLLSGIAMTGSLSLGALASTAAKLAVFLVAALVVGLLAVPRLVGYVAGFKSNEMLLVTVLALCFGFSLLAAKLGYSVALGAFIIGAVIAESREIHRVELLTEPVRDMFSAVFFVTIGLMIEPKLLLAHWLPVTVLTLVVIFGQSLSCAFGAFVAGNDTCTSLRVGFGLAQIGEFSFIIAALGLSLHVTGQFLYPIAVAVSVITTLLNPYLIRHADTFVHWFDRLAPTALVDYLGHYTRWVGQLGSVRPASMAARFARRWSLQIAINAALVAAVFGGATIVFHYPPLRLQRLHLEPDAVKGLLWLTAALASLPMLIAMIRKLQALSLLVAESRVTRARAGERTSAIRAVVAQSVFIAGFIMMLGYVLILSSALLPSFPTLLLPLAAIALAAFLLWRSFIKLYARAQIALMETFSHVPDAGPNLEERPLPGLLSAANIATVELSPGAPAAGKLILELELRTRTGASIVGIERTDGTRLVGPGADEELHAGDKLVLLGSKEQLDAARRLMLPSPLS